MNKRNLIGGLAASIAVLALAACGPKEAPKPAPPPPPKPQIVIPPKPYPPQGASPLLPVPQVGADGLFQSVNRGISPAQITWNLRAAYNVGALNCPSPARETITSGYRAFLQKHSRGLAAVNRAVDAEWRAKYGAGFVREREKYMTEVYNHYALPPAMDEFCNAVLAVSRDGALIKTTELAAFSARSLPSVEIVYDDFYRRYAQYRTDLAGWEARYGALVNAQPSTATGLTKAQ